MPSHRLRTSRSGQEPAKASPQNMHQYGRDKIRRSRAHCDSAGQGPGAEHGKAPQPRDRMAFRASAGGGLAGAGGYRAFQRSGWTTEAHDPGSGAARRVGPVLWRRAVRSGSSAKGGSVRFFGEGRFGAVTLAWEDIPVEWVEGQWLRHLRIFSRGPLRSLCASLRLTPDGDGGTIAHYLVEADAANP